MIHSKNTEIAVIGAGVIGMSIALRLAQDGREVVVIDPKVSDPGVSYGNAGTIADYAVQPVGTPDVLRNLPSLLFNKSSPLAIRPSAFFSLAPWLVRFARQSLPGAAAKNAASIAGLLASSNRDWHSFATQIGAAALLQKRGCLYLYETQKAYRGAQSDMAFRRQFGVSVDLISGQDLAAMEPNLPETAAGGAYFPNAVFLTDPGKALTFLEQAAQAAGVTFLTHRVDSIARNASGVSVKGKGLALNARQVVLAAGAYSKPLAAMAGDFVPLDTERGYHLEWDMAKPLLSRPVSPTARGFYLCPMDGRLRAAGTVELGGLSAPPSAHRLHVIEKGVRAFFPDLPEPSRTWMGFRPSMPDSLPVIGPSRRGKDIIHAYGHGHLGLSLAPITARLVCDVVAGRAPELDLTPYLPKRFGRSRR